MPHTILILGATGKTGSQLIRPLKSKGHLVRALVRDVNKGADLKKEGADIFVGDMLNLESLKDAFTGTTVVYVCTPVTPRALEMAEVIFKAAERFGRPHLVRLSVIGASINGPNENSRMHFQADDMLQRSGLNYTILKPNFFMDNLFLCLNSIALESKIEWPAGDVAVGMIDARDISESAIGVINNPSAHLGRTYVLSGPATVNFPSVCKTLSSQLGRETKYVKISPEAWNTMLVTKHGLDDFTAKNMALYTSTYNQMSVTTDDVKMLTGHIPRSLGDFCAEKLVPAIRQRMVQRGTGDVGYAPSQ